MDIDRTICLLFNYIFVNNFQTIYNDDRHVVPKRFILSINSIINWSMGVNSIDDAHATPKFSLVIYRFSWYDMNNNNKISELPLMRVKNKSIFPPRQHTMCSAYGIHVYLFFWWLLFSGKHWAKQLKQVTSNSNYVSDRIALMNTINSVVDHSLLLMHIVSHRFVFSIV